MNDSELQHIWSAYDRKINEATVLNAQSWALNLRCFEHMQYQKAQSKMRSLSRYNVIAIILGFIWAGFLGLLLIVDAFRHFYFSLSVGMIALFTVYAIAVYVKHNVMIASLDYEGPVVDTQQKLSSLQASTFQSIRIIWLQLPFYSTFFWSDGFIRTSGSKFWLIAFPITLLLFIMALIIYRSIRPENMHKKWVRSLLMAGPEYKNVMRSMVFLEEIESFKRELI